MNWQQVEAHPIPTLQSTSIDTHCLWWSFSWQRLKSTVIYCCFCARQYAQRKRAMREHWGDQWHTGKRPSLFLYIYLDHSSLLKILPPLVFSVFRSFFRRHSQNFWACQFYCSLPHRWRKRRFPMMCCWCFYPQKIELSQLPRTYLRREPFIRLPSKWFRF